jgi:hypothetical protein
LTGMVNLLSNLAAEVIDEMTGMIYPEREGTTRNNDTPGLSATRRVVACA